MDNLQNLAYFQIAIIFLSFAFLIFSLENYKPLDLIYQLNFVILYHLLINKINCNNDAILDTGKLGRKA